MFSALRLPVPSSWTALCRSKALSSKPRRFLIDGVPIVLFRNGEGVAALPDLCPHRLAPLSLGRVEQGLIECAYHGWRFDGSGQCRAMPGVAGDIPRVRIAPYFACEREGLIFVSRQATSHLPYGSRLSGKGVAQAWVQSRVPSTLVDVAENILDATHTHFTHKGLLRGLGAQRHRVSVTITGGPGWVEARYEGEPRQDGLISRFLEGGRGVSIGRFLAPGIAELEFWGPKAINLVTTFHLRQETAQTVAGLGSLSGPSSFGLGYIKAMLFKPLFRVALAQDRYILRHVSENREIFPSAKPLIDPLDILRSAIEAILRGEVPRVADQPVVAEMDL